ncbi:MAG TPA: hypothetical protein VHL79_18090 [Ramlibacter sp.]|jgi:hypothetical protein|nr:hypothetical protein [Ramlibacter sp.]
MPSIKTKDRQPGQSMQKSRAEGEHERARASGGKLRSQPADKPAGRSASTGGRADKSSVRSSANSRSSNSGDQGHAKRSGDGAKGRRVLK